MSLSRMCVLCTTLRLCVWSAHVQSEWFGVMSRRRDVLEESGACRRRCKGWREVCVLFSDVVLEQHYFGIILTVDTRQVASEVLQLLSDRHLNQTAARRDKYRSWFQ